MSEDYASMDKPQLTSMIHFLEERDEESKKLDEQLKVKKKSPQTSDLRHPTSSLIHHPSYISHQKTLDSCL